jgi:hypothetical protein
MDDASSRHRAPNEGSLSSWTLQRLRQRLGEMLDPWGGRAPEVFLRFRHTSGSEPLAARFSIYLLGRWVGCNCSVRSSEVIETFTVSLPCTLNRKASQFRLRLP